MSNSPWTLVTDKPVPEDRSVMLYLAKENLGCRYAFSKAQKISNGYMRVIDGLFEFDFEIEVLAWRELDGFDSELPMSLTGCEAEPPRKERATLANQVGISLEQARDLAQRHGGIVRPYEKDDAGKDISYGVTSYDNLVVPIPGGAEWDAYKRRFYQNLLIEKDEKESKDQ